MTVKILSSWVGYGLETGVRISAIFAVPAIANVLSRFGVEPQFATV